MLKELEYKQNMADWTPWFANGCVDAVIPMVYFDDDEMFGRAATEVAAAATGRHAYISLDAWRLSADVTVKQVRALRAKGSAGFVLFNYAYASKAISGGDTALTVLKTQCLSTKAAVPAMAWKQ